jgi:hypothetical protein
MRTEAERAWLKAMRETDSAEAASGLMHDWYLAMKLYHPLPLTLVLHNDLQMRQWQRARRHLEATFGRSSAPHDFLFHMLDAVLEKTRPAAGLPDATVTERPQRPVPGSDASALTRIFGR